MSLVNETSAIDGENKLELGYVKLSFSSITVADSWLVFENKFNSGFLVKGLIFGCFKFLIDWLCLGFFSPLLKKVLSAG